MLNLTHVRCCGLMNPIGLYDKPIDFSWVLESDKKNVVQKYYQIIVRDELTDEIMWDSGKVESCEQTGIRYAGKKLERLRKYIYTIEVEDNYKETSKNSVNFFSLVISRDQWQAKWIGCQSDDLDKSVKMATKEEMVKDFLASIQGGGFPEKAERNLETCNVYRKEFNVDVPVREAFLSITAHGLYDVKINGREITDTRLNPGFTAYDKYIEVQTYDVSDFLVQGTNVFTVLLADGWYRGTFGILGYGNNYGLELSVLAQINVVSQEKNYCCFATDDGFRYIKSNILYSDIMIGEKKDARIDYSYIDTPHADMSSAKFAEIKDYGYDNLEGICAEPVRVVEIFNAREVITTPLGETVVDFGQVIAGTVQLKVKGEAGSEIKLEFSEVLDKEGNFINNISGVNRDQTDYYILSGNENGEIYEPKYTFHGFRYMKVSGYPGKLTKEMTCALAYGSDLEMTGSFSCSNENLNKLQSNIQWSQRSNMISIPTDCPQRERAGWTGDIYIFANTAAYNQNVNSFLQKYLLNMEKEQFDNGLIPVIIPYPLGYNAMQEDAFGTDTSAGWGDAAIKVPYVLYQVYRDKGILERFYPMMKRWMDYVEKLCSDNMPEYEEEISKERRERQKYLWNTGFNFGDWCYPSCKNEKGETDMFRSAFTTKEHVATAMYACSAAMMSDICTILGKADLSVYYDDLNKKIRQAFMDEYVREDGSIDNNIQGIYVLALAMDMVSDDVKEKMAAHLAEMIHENNDCLDTGFLSVEHLLDVLENNGYGGTAKTILYQDRCPSWLYEVKNGATTTWETWNAIMEDGTVTKDSYNHYAFGCVGDWMYRNLAGIQKLESGYKTILIKPSFKYDLTYAEGIYDSIYGKIRSKWELEGKNGRLTADIPVGTTAKIVLPDRVENVGSGHYEFAFKMIPGSKD